MHRRVVRGVGVVVIIAIVVAIWLWWRHDRGASSGREVGHARSAVVVSAPTPPAGAPRAPRPQAWRDEIPAGGLRLEGQVVGPDGQGVGNALVSLDSPARTAVSQADGSFAFDQLITGAYTLEAAADALVGGPVVYRLTEHSDPLIIRLAPGSAVVVTVVDATYHPIAGAEIHVERGSVTRTLGTDAQGVARIASVQPSFLTLEVSAPGYAIALTKVAVGSPNLTIDVLVILRRGATVSGRVLDDAGQPIAGAQVTPFNGDYDALRDAAAVSDEHGDYAVAALPPGRYTMVAIDGEHAPAHSAAVALSDQPVSHVDVVMKRGGRLTGTVVDLQRQPVASARVTIFAPGSDVPSYREVIADAAGRFEARGVVRAALKISGDAAGARCAPLDVDLTTEPERAVELVLDLRGTIAGVVVDDHGAPAPEVEVQATRSKVMDPAVMVTRTGGDGRFVMRALEDGDYALSAVWRPGAPQVRRSDVDFGTPAHTGDQHVRLVLATPGKVVGRIAVAGVATIHPATIFLGPASTTTQADGSFHLDEVTPGAWQLIAHSPDFTDIMQAVKVESGATLDLGTIAASRGRTLRGTVIDASGVPIADAQVRIDFQFPGMPADLDEVQAIRTATTGRDGHFAVFGVPSKPTTVTADEPGRGRSPSLAIPPGSDDPPPVTLTVKR